MDLLATPKQLADLTDRELGSAYETHYTRASVIGSRLALIDPTDQEKAHSMLTNARLSFEIAREIWARAVNKRDRYKTRVAALRMGHSMCLIYSAADALEGINTGDHDTDGGMTNG